MDAPLEDPTTLRALYDLSTSLLRVDDLSEVAVCAACAVNALLPGRAILVTLWDDRAPDDELQVDGGEELSVLMHREPLVTPEGVVGELVVDADEPLSPAQVEALTLIADPAARAVRGLLVRRAHDEAQRAAVLALAYLAEHRDSETGRHVERMAEYCLLVAQGLAEDGHYTDEIDETFLDELALAAPLHDVGKVGIPDAVLLKRGKLEPEEWELMKTHAEIGARTLDRVIGDTVHPGYLSMARDVARCHHERWDGSGYPRGLEGAAIPLAARLVALADVYDALTTERPYKRAWSHLQAVEAISAGEGTHFDPEIVASFLVRLDEVDAIRLELADTEEEAPSLSGPL